MRVFVCICICAVKVVHVNVLRMSGLVLCYSSLSGIVILVEVTGHIKHRMV